MKRLSKQEIKDIITKIIREKNHGEVKVFVSQNYSFSKDLVSMIIDHTLDLIEYESFNLGYGRFNPIERGDQMKPEQNSKPVFFACVYCSYRHNRCVIHRLGAKACTSKSIAFRYGLYGKT